MGKDKVESKHLPMLESIFYNAKVGMAICNGENNIFEMVNPALATIYGYEISELIGAPSSKIFPLECMAKLATIEDAHNELSFEAIHSKKDGSLVHLSIYINKIKVEKNGRKQYILNIIDISESKYQEERLTKTKAKLSAVITTIPDLIWVKDTQGAYLMCNPAFERFFGASCGEIVGKTDYDFIEKEQADFFRQKDKEALAAGAMCINEEEIIFAENGQYALLETRKMPIYFNDEFMGVLGIGRDITERKEIEQKIRASESRLNEAQKIAKVGSWEVEYPGLKVYWSDEVYRIFEFTSGDWEPSFDHFLNVIHPDERAVIESLYNESLQNRSSFDVIHRLLMEDGRIKYVHELGETLYDNFGKPLRSIGTVQDITERKLIEKEMEHMAHHDSLTGLPNRILVKDRTTQIIAKSKRTGKKAAFLFIDLDGFKTINDSLGHSIGDILLKMVTKRLQSCIRASDTLSRQGGDEFLLILPDINDTKDVSVIADKLLGEFQKSFHIHNEKISSSASIGIAIYPDHGDSFEELFKSADAAMYKAKETGKNTYCFFTQQMKYSLIGLIKMQNDLKEALKNQEFILHYQPQIDLQTNTISGMEALIRWNHPLLGIIPPFDFIATAESTGLIVQIGEWVLLEACRQGALWHKQGKKILVAVNISAVQFKRGNLLEVVTKALQISGFNPRYLELELTESILIQDTENVLQTVKTIKELGVQLSIDDFGTGYSSLAYLKRFAVDKLKIDQSFVRDIVNDKEDANIVQIIIQMARSFNLKSIAEGVESLEILNLIKEFGCDEVQGYYFAKPMGSLEFEQYYENNYSKKEK
jgi:diguanylate cyclase (GGDEF)-like protein/PAS domain S-box-containing protein